MVICKNQKKPTLKDSCDRFMEPGDSRHGPLQQEQGRICHRTSVQNVDGILLESHTVDGRNPEPVDGKVIYPISYKVLLYIPGGFLAGFLNHQ